MLKKMMVTIPLKISLTWMNCLTTTPHLKGKYISNEIKNNQVWFTTAIHKSILVKNSFLKKYNT